MSTNPFPGLRPFLEEEEHLFFGRESQVDAMVDTLAASHFLVVVGTSGSGKSSLVNCGLRPALHRGMMSQAGTSWRIAQFRPGNNPISAMAEALAKEGALSSGAAEGPFSQSEMIESSLRMSKLGLLDVFEQARLPVGTNLLVVADQFEELFRFQEQSAIGVNARNDLADQAAAFVNLLLEVRAHKDLPIYVTLTMRSDFLGECAQFYGLPEAINAGQYLVPRMTRDERRRAIAGPVGVGGAEIDPVLLTRLVNDVGGNPDQLSILQHALNRTWRQWEREGSTGPLTLQHYEKIGTMAGALDQHAEKAYAELTTPRERKICEKLFKAITDKASDARGVRRPTSVDTLRKLSGATIEELTSVVDVFRKPSRSFLMPPSGEALKPGTVVDISHESLMRVWDRLRIWADEEARSAGTYRRLSETASLEANGKASLWTGPDLAGGLAWLRDEEPEACWADRYAPGFNEAIGFLQKSADAQAAEQQRHVDEAFERARTKERYARAIALLSVALVLAMVLAGVSYRRSVNLDTLQHEREKKKLTESANSLRQQVVTSQAVAVQSFAVDKQQPEDARKIHQSFEALAHISAITATASPTYHSNTKIQYFKKATDSPKLVAALNDLGFKDVSEGTASNPRETNAIWYGARVPENDVKLVAFALMRAGIDLQCIQPSVRIGPEVIQVGHNPWVQDQPPFLPDVVSKTPLAQLRRTEARTKPDVIGTITKMDPKAQEGWIQGPEGPVYFKFSPHPPPKPFNVGDAVTFTVYYGKPLYAEEVTARSQTPRPRTDRTGIAPSKRSAD
jgi:energy-coupling factor transporter ATP-binding protein EcfA2